MTSTSSSSSSSAPLQAPSPPSHDDPTSGPGASLQGVSAHGLVSLERAEHILQRVIDTVNDQGLQISSLYLLLQTLVGTETNPLPRSLLNVEGNFSRLNQRLEHVEKAIHVPGVAPGVSIGEVVSTNGVELNHALDALHKKANQADVEARQHKLEEEVAEVYAWAGARELVERLEESNRATRTQVHAMEAALGCKVDKAEMAGMEATLNRLKVFNSRMEGLEQRQAQDMAGVRAEVQLLQERRLAAEQQLEVTRKALGALEEKHGAWKRETLELLKEVGGWGGGRARGKAGRRKGWSRGEIKCSEHVASPGVSFLIFSLHNTHSPFLPPFSPPSPRWMESWHRQRRWLNWKASSTRGCGRENGG